MVYYISVVLSGSCGRFASLKRKQSVEQATLVLKREPKKARARENVERCRGDFYGHARLRRLVYSL